MSFDNNGSGLIFQGMISVRAVIESRSRPIDTVYYDLARCENHKGELAWIKHRAEELGFEVRESTADEMTEMFGRSHGGVCAVCGERELRAVTPDDLEPNGFYLMLEGIEDPYNFGFSVRSAYAAGATGIILPERNWMDSAGTVCRSSAGAGERIPMFLSEGAATVEAFRSRGYRVVAAEIRDSGDMWDADLSFPLLLIVGGEKRGISRALLDMCDARVRISYGRDFREALSASSASAVLCFEAARQNRKRAEK